VLYLRDKRVSNVQFIGVYLLIIGLNASLWWVFPSFAYILFLLLSAYHFGQSQFSHYFQKQSLPHLLLFLFWGISILSALIYFNLDEIYLIMESTPEFAVFDPLHQRQDMLYVLVSSCSITLLIKLFLTLKSSLTLHDFMMEVLVLTLILVSFFLMPLIIGFTLYFVILHSFKVLREEYGFLTAQNEANSIAQFIKMVAPFTLFSIAGILILFSAIYFQFLNLPYGYCLLIVISSITLPHVFVMNKFYFLFQGMK
jgi:beta-carotene 15,15'-dioxygenase